MKWSIIVLLILFFIAGCAEEKENLNFEFNLERDLVLNIVPYSVNNEETEEIRILSFEDNVIVLENKASKDSGKFTREQVKLEANEEEIVTSMTLMWLSKESYVWLKYEGKTQWNIEFMRSTVVTETLGTVVEASSSRDLFVLENNGEITYPVVVNNGVENLTVNMKAIKARDTFSNDYVILDNKNNPLVLEFKPNLVTGRALELFGVPGFKIAEGYRLESVKLP